MATQSAYEKYYKIRTTGEDGLNIVVSIPRVVIEREAKRRNLTVAEFIEQYCAVAQYDSFEGIHYMFKKKENEK